jgi:hypothetical protein
MRRPIESILNPGSASEFHVLLVFRYCGLQGDSRVGGRSCWAAEAPQGAHGRLQVHEAARVRHRVQLEGRPRALLTPPFLCSNVHDCSLEVLMWSSSLDASCCRLTCVDCLLSPNPFGLERSSKESICLHGQQVFDG